VLRIFDHIEMLGDDYGWERFITGFFRNCSMADLRLGNLHSFLSWVMFSEFYKDLNEEQLEEIDFVVAEAGRRFGYHPPTGFNPDVKHVAMTLEPIPFIHRPLIIYLSNSLMELTFQATYFRYFGFQRFTCSGTSYWYRPGVSTNLDNTESEPPLLVLHGITNGWVTYSYLVHSIMALANTSARGVFLVDVDAIKIKSLCFDVPDPDEFPKAIKAVLTKHGVSKVSVVGHSFGSITAGSFNRPSIVLISFLNVICVFRLVCIKLP
jgi:hypothetical protein